MSEDWFRDRLELHRIYLEARSRTNSFYERLAILDGGTVALVVTAVLGPFRGNLHHKHLIAVGLTFLVFAMIVLLLSNLLAARREFHIVGETTNDPATRQPEMRNLASRLDVGIHVSQFVGALSSAIGILLLLIEVWLIF